MKTTENYAEYILLAWQGKLQPTQLISYAGELEEKGLRGLAAVLYQTWLGKNTSSPIAHAVFYNLAVTLSNEMDLAGAESAYREAIHRAPGFLQPRINLGLLFEKQKMLPQAIEQWMWVANNIAATPENKIWVTTALNHLGRALESAKSFPEAESFLTRSLAIDPDQADVIHHLVSIRQKQCAWPVFPEIAGVSQESLKKNTSALSMLSISDDPAVQLSTAQHYIDRKVRKDLPRLAPFVGYRHKKLRIGYASSDFSLHPVSMLTVEMFELHDRSKFDIYGYCWSPEDGSPLRKRVISAMDQFKRIGHLSDEDAARLIREDEIDILIDLQGQTAGARIDMLSYRPAPIQITYLGLPATTAHPAIDYVIADRFLIPEELARYYSERPIYMPDVYMVSDRKRTSSPAPSRSSCGLPEEGFVFCSFNNSNKYTPQIFDAWARILQRVPGSVLWLLAEQPVVRHNLAREAALRGIPPERVIFSSRVSPEDYLARFRIADLFLDTFPFNAGTTANDALWEELPVLTLCGQSFGSRMASALLKCAELPELITNDLITYEGRAVELASNPVELQKIRERLSHAKTSSPLFDTPLFTKNLELIFQNLSPR